MHDSDNDCELEEAAKVTDTHQKEDDVYQAVSQELGTMSKEFTVIAGLSFGGSEAAEGCITRIMDAAKMPSAKRPDLICHHLSSWNSLLWIRWMSDHDPPFHDELYLCFPEMASPAALPISEENKELFKVDMLTKICQLSSQRGVTALLAASFRLLAPNLESYFRTLSPHLSSRPGAKPNDKSPHAQVLASFEAGLAALKDTLGVEHSVVDRATCELAATYEAHGSEEDLRLDGVPEAQRCFRMCVSHLKDRIFCVENTSSLVRSPATDKRLREMKLKMAGVLKRMHTKEQIQMAAAVYEDLGESELALQTREDADLWQS
eukprot:CAMPEP_0114250298 /NCGR_PEP_ID=MMETSP0058-20121206/14621_1 /TAXON_ID=36894 /ORGANISM="Pyramimonas parkeae, CCMP726" /LENGTH=319 /DNA_ID=CAMNT_0001363941 /DNA_START=321 /DNA_END=1280 /DNA_ORIENTATION=+